MTNVFRTIKNFVVNMPCYQKYTLSSVAYFVGLNTLIAYDISSKNNYIDNYKTNNNQCMHIIRVAMDREI